MTCRLNIRLPSEKKKFQLTIVRNTTKCEKYESAELKEGLSFLDTTDSRELLKDWASWRKSANGYPSSTTVWRLANAPGEDTFGSRIPSGIIPPRRFERLENVFNELLGTKRWGEIVSTTRAFYLEGLESTKDYFSISGRTVYDRKKKFEEYIQKKLF